MKNGPFTYEYKTTADTFQVCSAFEFRMEVETPKNQINSFTPRIENKYYAVVNQDELILFVDRYNNINYTEVYVRKK